MGDFDLCFGKNSEGPSPLKPGGHNSYDSQKPLQNFWLLAVEVLPGRALTSLTGWRSSVPLLNVGAVEGLHSYRVFAVVHPTDLSVGLHHLCLPDWHLECFLEWITVFSPFCPCIPVREGDTPRRFCFVYMYVEVTRFGLNQLDQAASVPRASLNATFIFVTSQVALDKTSLCIHEARCWFV